MSPPVEQVGTNRIAPGTLQRFIFIAATKYGTPLDCPILLLGAALLRVYESMWFTLTTSYVCINWFLTMYVPSAYD